MKSEHTHSTIAGVSKYCPKSRCIFQVYVCEIRFKMPIKVFVRIKMVKNSELIKVIHGFVLDLGLRRRQSVLHNYWTKIMKIQP